MCKKQILGVSFIYFFKLHFLKFKRVQKFFFLFILQLILGLVAVCQDLKIETGIRSGWLIVHRENMAHLPVDNSSSVELNYFFRKINNSNEKFKSGLSFSFGSLGNEKILGNYIGLTTFYTLPIFHSNRNEFDFRVGAGLSYVNKIFNLENNQKNSAISSNFNALIDFSFYHSISILNRYDIYYGLAFKHLSNGATRVPNLGLNYPELRLGVGLKSVKKNNLVDINNPVRLKSSISFVGGGFFKQIIENYGVNYPVYYGSIFSQFGLKQNLSCEVGLDAMYNSSLVYLFYSNKNLIVDNSNAFQVGAYVGGNAHINKLHLLIGMGGYVFDRYRLNGEFYHKLSLRYKPFSNFVFGIGIKSHWLNADYFELVGGFVF